MGTNYYLTIHEGEKCPHCGRSDSVKKLHIGKSSAGWCFSLHVMPEDGIASLEDWQKLFPEGKIEDEYGRSVTTEEMLQCITARRWPKQRDPKYKEQFSRENGSIDGPNNLARASDAYAHGEGTWDCITGDFS